MAPFYGQGSTVSAVEPLRGESRLLLTTISTGIPGTHLKYKAESPLEPPSDFELGNPELGIQHPKPLLHEVAQYIELIERCMRHILP